MRMFAFIDKKVALTLVLTGLFVAGPATAALTEFQTFTGKVGYSADGFGSVDQTGTISASVPVGATVEAAYLYTSMFSNPTGTGSGGTLGGIAVAYGPTVPNTDTCCGLSMRRADVTSIVKPVIDGGPGGIYDFTVTETDASQDGEALVVVYSLAALPDATFAILDGFSASSGDTATVNFDDPLNPGDPSFFAEMFLGIGFSCCGQASTVTVNGTVITTNAGNNDDGVGPIANGQLITAGGFDDTFSPFLPSYEDDTEHYNLVPQITLGDTSIVINTLNPSNDDNIFLAGFYVLGLAEVTLPPSLTPDAMDDVADDTVTNQPVAVAVLTNDDLGDEPAMVTVTTPPLNGMTSQVACDMATEANKGNCLVTYTPDAGFGGDDFFIYTLTDFDGDTDTARVDVFVEAEVAVAEPDGDNNVTVFASADNPNNTNAINMSYTKVEVAGDVTAGGCTAPALRETWGHGYGHFGFFKPKYIDIRKLLDASDDPRCAELRAQIPKAIYISPTQRVLPNPNLSDDDRQALYFGKEPEDFAARAALRWVFYIITSDAVTSNVAVISGNAAKEIGYEGECEEVFHDRDDSREFRGVMGGTSIDPMEKIRVFRTTTWDCDRSRSGRRSSSIGILLNMRNDHFSSFGYKLETVLSLIGLYSEVKKELKSTDCEVNVKSELKALKSQIKKTKKVFLKARTAQQVLTKAVPEFDELLLQTVNFPSCPDNVGARFAELAGAAAFMACDYSGHPVDRVKADCPISPDVLDVIISD